MKAMLLLALVLTVVPGLAADQLRVLKHGDDLFVRSSFSPTDDLLVRVGKGRNGQFNYSSAFLLKAEAGMTPADLGAGRLIHGNGDDATPWNLNGTYIGANHGCSDGREVTVPAHGLTTADLGSQWQDAAGTTFVVLKIVDADHFWMLSLNQGTGDIWRFITAVKGPTLQRAADGKTLTFTECKMAQIIPACRLGRQDVLVDGKTTLAEDTPVTCAFLDLVEDYDIISPAALVADFVAHPGEARSFVGPDLQAVVRNHIVYRFFPNGANVITTRSEALLDFNLGYMGFVQSAKLTPGTAYDSHTYLIPKTVPFTQDNLTWDFRAGQDYSVKLVTPLIFSAAKGNLADPQNLPDRFIQLLGHKTADGIVNEVGYALGYSLISGMTVPAERAKNARQALMLYTSTKTYPTACDSGMGNPVKRGTPFECVAYRQYFRPDSAQPGTILYWHPEGDDLVVTVEFHRSLDHATVALPAAWAGKSVTVVEQTPSVTLHTTGPLPATGVVISVADGYGYLVLQVK